MAILWVSRLVRVSDMIWSLLRLVCAFQWGLCILRRTGPNSKCMRIDLTSKRRPITVDIRTWLRYCTWFTAILNADGGSIVFKHVPQYICLRNACPSFAFTRGRRRGRVRPSSADSAERGQLYPWAGPGKRVRETRGPIPQRGKRRRERTGTSVRATSLACDWRQKDGEEETQWTEPRVLWTLLDSPGHPVVKLKHEELQEWQPKWHVLPGKHEERGDGLKTVEELVHVAHQERHHEN